MKLCDVLFLAIIAVCLVSLVGCTDRSEPLPIVAAPALRNWTPEEECKLARTLAVFPSDSILWTLHDDWARMRREEGFKAKPSHYKCKESIEQGRLLT